MINFRDEIDKYIASKPKHESSGKFNPSMLGQCLRKQVYKRLGIEQTNPPDERTLRVFEVGHMMEEWVLNIAYKYATKDRQVKVEDDDFVGYADLVIEDRVIDIKTQHSFAFHYMEKDGYDIKTEKLNSILQVLFYASMLGKEKGELVFLSKDDLCIYQHTFLLSEFKDMLNNEIARLINYWRNEIIPSATPRCYGVDKKTGQSKECQDYCPYRDYCKIQEQKEYIKNA